MSPLIKATRPVNEMPVPEKEVCACPECGRVSNVRFLENWRGRKRCFCTGCLLEFDSTGKIYTACEPENAQDKAQDKLRVKPQPKIKPREKRFSAAKRFNRVWAVSQAEKVIELFRAIVKQGEDPLIAIQMVGEEIGRDPDEVLILIVDVSGNGWKVQPDKEPKTFPESVREIFQ